MIKESIKIVYFDGHCVLCNGLVDFLLKKNSDLKFASLQGATAKQRLATGLYSQLNTIVYECDSVFYVQSEAVLRLLSLVYSQVLVFLWVPKFLRDGVYRLVAANRYALFGRNEMCRIPTALERNRILD